MITPPSPPKWRRRRFVVVTTAVFLLGLGWWFWPRVDQRFVGRWVRDLPKKNELGPYFIEFRRDGGGSFGFNGYDSMNFVWKMKGQYLNLQLGRDPGLYGLLNRVQKSIIQARPHLEHGSQRFFVSTVTLDRIVWQPLTDGQTVPIEGEEVFDMKRVPR